MITVGIHAQNDIEEFNPFIQHLTGDDVDCITIRIGDATIFLEDMEHVKKFHEILNNFIKGE